MSQHSVYYLSLLLGPLLFLSTVVLPVPVGIAGEAWLVCGLAAWMMVWWITEVVPLAVTALLPVIVLPLAGIVDLAEATAPYANPVIFLFLGGFLLALGIQSSGLHRRLAFLIVGLGGDRLDHLVAMIMLATAVLSMWISNTAAAAILLPVALSVLALAGQHGTVRQDVLAPTLLIGVAFAANIGGMATLIGTPPNAIMVAWLAEQHDIRLSFVGWMVFALPLSLSLLLIAWYLLVRWSFPLGRDTVPGLADGFRQHRAELGDWTPCERRVAVVFLLAVLAWVLRPLSEDWLPALDDPMIALIAGGLLFLVRGSQPGQAVLDWEATRQLPWGVLILIGGGLSLGAAVQGSGLAEFIAELLRATTNYPLALLVLVVATVTMLISHVTSNTAAAATLIPVATAIALNAGIDPLYLAMPVALAASCAFMLPTATPPNAIVFASNRLRVTQLIRAGSLLSIAAIGVLALFATLLALWIQ